VNSAVTAMQKLIMIVTMPEVAESSIAGINKMTYVTDFKLPNILDMHYVKPTKNNLKRSNKMPEIPWNTHLVSYDTLTCRVKPFSNGQFSHDSWRFTILDEVY
jgi:hypothetical protein